MPTAPVKLLVDIDHFEPFHETLTSDGGRQMPGLRVDDVPSLGSALPYPLDMSSGTSDGNKKPVPQLGELVGTLLIVAPHTKVARLEVGGGSNTVCSDWARACVAVESGARAGPTAASEPSACRIVSFSDSGVSLR